MLRNTELYYIAAECQPDAAKALAYLNQVRAHRGLPALAATVNIQNEIRKEYMKEFYGEGQLFYYYKRRAETTIPSAISTGATIAMNKAKYVVPLPLSETQYR
ncbi:RagB/SusD family nutrient uptake outer membrane protein [Chitinophaga sedimenti]|uniref:RagB/SusD family nutrient uptake outer membrane protein n=1 Tax=Chitinophaga sedimenti TaxID=2033606 RepID=UPI002006710B|nr:RagB/SusD family nutrient uptake outer membrane protein [Chitinophaga sedimenti]MCK7554828.1 RagB/SusD family nutrient uptake outer membrane protein [Chitinophaga sedimenti]